MPSMQTSIRIDAPASAVYDVITDLHSAADRISGIKSIEVLTDGEFGVGTRFRETRVMFGKEATEEMEITAVTPGESYVVEAESCGSHYTSLISVAPDGDGSRLTWEFGARPLSLMAKVMGTVMMPFMKGVMQKAMDKDFADIKAAVEARQ